MAGVITKPACRAPIVNSPPPTFHTDENISTAMRDMLATFAEAEGQLQEFLDAFTALKLGACTGTMQGNHIRQMFHQFDEWIDDLKDLSTFDDLELILEIWRRIRYYIRRPLEHKHASHHVKELCYQFGFELNSRFPEIRWRTYFGIVVGIFPKFICEGVNLRMGDEDWVESFIRGIKSAHTSKEGGIANALHSNEPEYQIISKGQLIADIGLVSETLEAQFETEEYHCHRCYGLGHNCRTCDKVP